MQCAFFARCQRLFIQRIFFFYVCCSIHVPENVRLRLSVFQPMPRFCLVRCHGTTNRFVYANLHATVSVDSVLSHAN